MSRFIVISARKLAIWRAKACLQGWNTEDCPVNWINAQLYSMHVDHIQRRLIWDSIQSRTDKLMRVKS